jgi:hypothetical protein
MTFLQRLRANQSKILLGLAVAFLAIQTIRPARNVSATAPFTGKDELPVLYPPSPEVRQMLATSCYDCHSNQTHYPWYAEIQPVGWWLANHIKDGRRHLNFSEFGTYPRKRQLKKLEEIGDEVRDHAMPLSSYTLVHRDAKLTAAQITALARWAEEAREHLPAK